MHKTKEKELAPDDLKQLEAKIELLEKYKKAQAGDPEKDELLEKFKSAAKAKNWLTYQEGYEKSVETEQAALDGYGTRFLHLKQIMCLSYLHFKNKFINNDIFSPSV